jgi:PilZ domain
MSISQVPFSRRANGLASRLAPDRRRHRRVVVTLLGRFMRANKQEYPCKLHDISVAGAAVMSAVDVEIGERIICYFDHLGGIEGTVVRAIQGGFALKLQVTPHKREKLAAQLTWLINREPGAAPERRHERVPAPAGFQNLVLAEGVTVAVRLLDVSMSGASIATNARPPLGLIVTIGKLQAKVMRHHSEGIGVEFIDVQNPTALTKHFE